MVPWDLSPAASTIPALALANLVETNLSEPSGIGGGPDTAFWVCPNGNIFGAPGNGPLDWNCNGDTTGTALTVDVNQDGVNTTLTGFFDWGNIKFDFQNSGGFEDGDHTSAPVQEIDYPTFRQTIAADLKIAATASPSPALTGSNVTYTIKRHEPSFRSRRERRRFGQSSACTPVRLLLGKRRRRVRWLG